MVIRTAYGDATGRIFLIAGFVAIVTLIAVAFIPNRPLRKTIDLVEEPVDDTSAPFEQPTTVPAELDGHRVR